MREERVSKTQSLAYRWYDGGALIGLRLIRVTILAPVVLIGLCVVLPAWLWHAEHAVRVAKRRKPQQESAMSMSTTLRGYLETEGRPYELLRHERTFTSMETAEAAHVPGKRLAKTVLVEDEKGYLLAVIPATHRLRFGLMRERFGHHFGLATEREMLALFGECETGAVPPFGEAYGLRVLVDDALLDEDDVYCESGDHTQLVRDRKSVV